MRPITPREIVGFLQNPWFMADTPHSMIAAYCENPDFRRKVLSRTYAGQRLRRVMGDWFNEIHWDNANPNHGVTPTQAFPPDIMHMMRVIDEQQPRLVVALGRNAALGMTRVNHLRVPIPVIEMPHPNARGVLDEDFKWLVMSMKLATVND